MSLIEHLTSVHRMTKGLIAEGDTQRLDAYLEQYANDETDVQVSKTILVVMNGATLAESTQAIKARIRESFQKKNQALLNSHQAQAV